MINRVFFVHNEHQTLIKYDSLYRHMGTNQTGELVWMNKNIVHNPGHGYTTTEVYYIRETHDQ